MAGHDRPALGDEEMRAAVQNPIGTPRLSELARGKKKVVILFDDLPKPTPTSRIVPFVLEELHAGGISRRQIRFVCAPGTHRPLIYPEFVAKLGQSDRGEVPGLQPQHLGEPGQRRHHQPGHAGAGQPRVRLLRPAPRHRQPHPARRGRLRRRRQAGPAGGLPASTPSPSTTRTWPRAPTSRATRRAWRTIASASTSRRRRAWRGCTSRSTPC